MRKIDHCLSPGIVYDSNIPFHKFLMGSTFFPSAESHKPAERGWSSPPSLSLVATRHLTLIDESREAAGTPPDSASSLRPALAGGVPPDYNSINGKL